MSAGQNMRDHHPGVQCYCLSCFRQFRSSNPPEPAVLDAAAALAALAKGVDLPDAEELRRDMLAYGVAVTKGGRRITPESFWAESNEEKR